MSEGTKEIQQMSSIIKRTVICDGCRSEVVTKLSESEWVPSLPVPDGWYRFGFQRGDSSGVWDQFDFCSTDCLDALKPLVTKG